MRTNAGADWMAAQLGSTTPGTNGANYIALTANSSAPSLTDTVLTGEITTGAGTLKRAQATYAHTAGTSVYTLSKTFTGNASDVYPVTPAKVGIFTAISGGVLVFETLIPSPPTLGASGDAIAITETVTI